MRIQKKRAEPGGKDVVLWTMTLFKDIQHFKGKRNGDLTVCEQGESQFIVILARYLDLKHFSRSPKGDSSQ
jgi:hypothetical protein